LTRSILTPFRRDKKNDFASGTGDQLLKSQVIQVLTIEGDTPKSSGELPWRTSQGSVIHLALHHNNDAVIAELVRVHARDALKKWLPNVTVTALDVRQEPAVLFLKVQYRRRDKREGNVEIRF
jgi:uncharacterized protein